jgi:hypothetical protein
MQVLPGRESDRGADGGLCRGTGKDLKTKGKKMTKSKWLLFDAVFLIIVAIILCFGIGGCEQKKAEAYPDKAKLEFPVMLPGHERPPQDWLEEYARLVALQEKIKKVSEQDGLPQMIDQANGMGTRLERSVPQGKIFDKSDLSFHVPDKPTFTVNPPPQNPVPAPQAAPPPKRK